MRSGSTRMLMATLACILTMGLLASCSDAGETATGDTTPDGEPVVDGPTLEDVNLQEEDGPGEPGGKITYGLDGESDGWNPTTGRWSPAALVVAKSLFETLAAYDAELNWKANFAEAFERYDVAALTALMHEEATLSMPPFDLWLRGHESIAKWMLGQGAGCLGSRLHSRRRVRSARRLLPLP